MSMQDHVISNEAEQQSLFDETGNLNTGLTPFGESGGQDSDFGLDLLQKFDAVQVESVSMISDADREVCEEHERKFNEAIMFANQYVEFVSKHGVTENRYMKSKDSLIDDMTNAMKNAVENFVDQVVWYFQSTYSVQTLRARDIKDKYKDDFSLTHPQIVDEIIVQLDGMNFRELGVKEIKERIQKHIYNKENIAVKGAKVTISRLLYFKSNDWRKGYSDLSWGHRDCFTHLMSAISHFDSGSMTLHGDLDLCSRGGEYSDEYWFSEFDFSYKNKLQSLKFYKNGKVDLKFQSSELALEFAKEYLGYNK